MHRPDRTQRRRQDHDDALDHRPDAAAQGAGGVERAGHRQLGPHRICRLGIGFVPEDRRIFPELSVWENLDIARRAGAGGKMTWREEQVFALFPDLAEIRDRRGGVLSGGQQQMLTIARTLMGNPELLLLDEPSEGLAPLIVELLRQRVAELKATGLSIVLAEQNLQFVMALADRVYILEKAKCASPARRPICGPIRVSCTSTSPSDAVLI
jgi:ABC-type branched-subunit amino acid transport system ATPase component